MHYMCFLEMKCRPCRHVYILKAFIQGWLVLRFELDCVKGCAEIFNGIHTTLDLVDRKLKKMQLDLADEALRALYKQVQREADTLREACGSFNKSSVGLNVDITLLETFEKENYWSYIDDWYNNFSSANKGTPFIRKFLEKAIPQLSVPSLR